MQLRVLALVVAWGLVGCAPHIHVVQRRFSREFNCPARETKKRSLGAGAL